MKITEKYKWLKWVAGITATIFLGAVGSGVWDLFLKDIFYACGGIFLKLISFGFSSIRESTYEEIAKGSYDRSSLFLLNVFLFGMSVLFGYVLAILRPRKLETDKEPQSNSVRVINKILSSVFIFTFIFLLAINFFRIIQISYQTDAVVHFKQCLTICNPYLTASEILEIKSNFASIKNRDDYISIIKILGKKAQANKRELPKLRYW